MIDKQLLTILQCPACEKGDLVQNIETELVCVTCDKKYVVKDNIPILLVDYHSENE
jgi:uncharacterized protein YbaR (Trm112 family)